MITYDQVKSFAHSLKTNESAVFREYLQILFLSKFYKHEGSNKVFFKGGTAIHLLLGAPRFSEDLDFTVMLTEEKFGLLTKTVFDEISKEEEISFKERETIAGKGYLLTAKPGLLPYATFINLDFSFREMVMRPEKSTLDTTYPIILTSFIHHLSKEELCAEKVRALTTRHKGRDLYDLWFLLSKGVRIEDELVEKKLKYYKIKYSGLGKLLLKINEFSEKEYVSDLRPFVPINEREKLKESFGYTKEYLINKLSKI